MKMINKPLHPKRTLIVLKISLLRHKNHKKMFNLLEKCSNYLRVRVQEKVYQLEEGTLLKIKWWCKVLTEYKTVEVSTIRCLCLCSSNRIIIWLQRLRLISLIRLHKLSILLLLVLHSRQTKILLILIRLLVHKVKIYNKNILKC